MDEKEYDEIIKEIKEITDNADIIQIYKYFNRSMRNLKQLLDVAVMIKERDGELDMLKKNYLDITFQENLEILLSKGFISLLLPILKFEMENTIGKTIKFEIQELKKQID